jgi:exopolysaccharide biosynthesis protein
MARSISKTVLFSGKRRPHSEVRQNADLKTPRKKKAVKRLMIAAVAVVLLAGLYGAAIFSNIPIIKKWRDIYIETAMDTFSHKWLATFFIPASVIDGVMAEKDRVIAGQQDLHSTWADPPPTDTGPEISAQTAEVSTDPAEAFLEKYSELDGPSFRDYVSRHPDVVKNGYNHILINEAGLKDRGTTIKTIRGDQVLAVDAENDLIIVKITGDGFVGKMAIVKDPSRVRLGISKSFGSYGQPVAQIAKQNNGVLAINASGFMDDEGKGNGGVVTGLLIADGKKYSEAVRGTFLNIGFSEKDRLYIGVSTKEIKYRDAVEFVPALIVNGENVIASKKLSNGSMGFGIQPRTAIGQTEDGAVLLMTVDGRQVGYSLGCCVTDCADIMVKYGAVQASNLDGGSSTVMVYRGEVITDPCSGQDYGRLVPDAFVVTYAPGA